MRLCSAKLWLDFRGAEPAAVAAAYDFSKFETVVDVGGATGNLLATILGRHLEPSGILFDLPHVVGDAPALINASGLADRIRIEAGNFFEGIPAAVTPTYSPTSSTIGARPNA
jgi:hypothetical protein